MGTRCWIIQVCLRVPAALEEGNRRDRGTEGQRRCDTAVAEGPWVRSSTRNPDAAGCQVPWSHLCSVPWLEEGGIIVSSRSLPCCVGSWF